MSRIMGFTVGVRALFRGFFMLIKNPRLWPLALIPTVLNLLILSLMFAVFIHYYGDVYSWMSAHVGRLELQNAVEWYMKLLAGLLWVLDKVFQAFLVLASLVVLLIVSYAIGMIVSAPFTDALSEKVEHILTGAEPPPFTFAKFLKDVARTIKAEAIKSLVLISIPIVLFVLNLIPVIGGPLYVGFTFLFGAMDLGFAFTDITMARKVMTAGERFRFARKNKWELAGLGIGFVVPFFTLIFSAPMTVAGTMLYVEKAMPVDNLNPAA